MSSNLTSKQKYAISHISGLVLINAMIFQEILSEHDGRVNSLQKILMEDNPQVAFVNHWDYIVKKINYFPIFNVAKQLLIVLSSGKDVLEALNELSRSAQQIVSMRAALRHDLMGRIYHRLLVEAKYLGTYYTGIPAAMMLLNLALQPEKWEKDWHKLDAISKFRVADLACGTGTLLMAAADAITDNYIRYSIDHHNEVDLKKLNNILAEKVLYGYDVLASAIHLTASTIALRAPEITFTKMNLFNMPFAGSHWRLGSLEFIKDKKVQAVPDLFGAISEIEQITGKETGDTATAVVPDIDLCVMNPPFTRSVGGNLLFGSAPEKERTMMQKELKRLVADTNTQASITAGLGSVFTAIADRYIKPAGRIALVLPKALISGVAWEHTRQLLRQKYSIEYLITSHDPKRWNFSESTDLSEILIIASKKPAHLPKKKNNFMALNLWHNPTTALEALTIAHYLSKSTPPDIVKGQGASEIIIGDTKMGEAISYPTNEFQEGSIWILPCAFAQADLIRTALHLIKGELRIPGYAKLFKIPLCNLSELGQIGPDCRDIHDGFKTCNTKTAYPSFWSHDAKAVTTLDQKPNRFLNPLSKAKKNRPLRKVDDLWPLAGRILIAERLWLNTIRLPAIRLSKKILSNVWWPFSLKPELETQRNEKALVLWMNSSLGLIMLLSHRVDTRGAWVKFKKPILSKMPGLDIRMLPAEQIKTLASAYDHLSDKSLLPLPEMAQDAVRAEIDKAIAKALNLPDLSILRELLAQEPIVCLRQLQ